jgi:hypothetical protein
MTLRQDIIDQIAALQAQLSILNTAPPDTYNFGTVVVFASTGHKWYYAKTAEETWLQLNGTSVIEKSLSEWILEAKQSGIGYFEVYIMTVAPTPIYASS